MNIQTFPTISTNPLAKYFRMNKFLVIIGLLATFVIFETCGHIRVREPPNRSSIWRDPRFEYLNPTVNEDDDGLYCGEVFQPVIANNCGICGDPATDPVPRPNEHGGKYGNGVISANYTAGQVS